MEDEFHNSVSAGRIRHVMWSWEHKILRHKKFHVVAGLCCVSSRLFMAGPWYNYYDAFCNHSLNRFCSIQEHPAWRGSSLAHEEEGWACSFKAARSQKYMSSGIQVKQSCLVQENTPPMCTTHHWVQSKEGQSQLWRRLGYSRGFRGWKRNPVKLWLT